jgi:hypothetical protein
MANAYEKLVEAGAPAIVEPLFYRIYEDNFEKDLVVEVRERRPYKGSNRLAYRRVDLYGLPSELPRRLAEAATEAVMEVDTKSVVAEFTGDLSSDG